MTSVLNKPIVLAASALSYQSSTLPTDESIPDSANRSGKNVHHESHINHACQLETYVKSDTQSPFGHRRNKRPVFLVIRAWPGGVRIGCLDFATPSNALSFQGFHQAFYGASCDIIALVPQAVPNFASPIALATCLENTLDIGAINHITSGAIRGQFTLAFYRCPSVICHLSLNAGHSTRGGAKYADAFLRNSLAWRSSRLSRSRVLSRAFSPWSIHRALRHRVRPDGTRSAGCPVSNQVSIRWPCKLRYRCNSLRGFL